MLNVSLADCPLVIKLALCLGALYRLSQIPIICTQKYLFITLAKMLSSTASVNSRDILFHANKLEKIATSLGIKKPRPSPFKRIVSPISPPIGRELEYVRMCETKDTRYVSLEDAQKTRSISHRSIELLDVEPTGPSVSMKINWRSQFELIPLDEARRTAHIARRTVELL